MRSRVALITDLPILDTLTSYLRGRGFDVEARKMDGVDNLEIFIDKFDVIVIGPDLPTSQNMLRLVDMVKKSHSERKSKTALITIIRSVREIDELGAIYPFMDYVRCPFDIEQLFLIIKRGLARL